MSTSLRDRTGPPPRPGSSLWDGPLRPLVAACLGTFLLIVYTTIVTVALPQIGSDLGGGFTSLQWIVNVFTIALAGLLLGMGSLSDVLGRKRVYLAGIGVFTLATLACGLASSAGMLIAARAVQGAAGAAMFATILPLVGLTYQGRARAQAFAVWGAVAGAASAIGTVAGGLLAAVGWRWIFLGTLPVCVFAAFLAATSLQESQRADSRVDYAGIVTFTVAATALTYAIIDSGDHGWTAPGTLVSAGVAVLAVAAFAVSQRRHSTPMVPLELFGTRPFLGVLVVAFVYYFATFGALPVISMWLQDTVKLGSASTSLVLVVQVVLFVVVSALVSGRLHSRPPGAVLGGATVMIGVGCLAALTVAFRPTWDALLPMLVITGLGAGIVSPIFPAVAIASVPESHSGTAGAAANSARQLGLAIGIAVCGAIFSRHSGTGQETTGLLQVMLVCGALGVAGGFVAGWLLRGHRHVPV